MNIILVLIDSLNRNDLEAYGSTECATPNIQKFAQKAWRFDNHFVGSLPCMPARREIFAGVSEFLWRPWGPLEPFDAQLPRILSTNGYATGIVTDHYHYWEETANGYVQSFESSHLVRGHENDNWRALQPVSDLPQWARNIDGWRPGEGRRYFSNTANFRGELDYFPAQVMSNGVAWLERRPVDRPFFLQVESFDVHEPFDVPEPYASLYGNGADRDRFTIWPPYQHPGQLAEFMRQPGVDEQLRFVRSQYLGKLTMVDRWFGELMAALDRDKLWNQTAVILTTDHGHDLGQRGCFGKHYPHFDTHAHIPFLVWFPTCPGDGQRISALTTTVDLHSTILELADLPSARNGTGRSLVPLLRGDDGDQRPGLIYGTFGQGICCTDGKWTLMTAPREGELFAYTSIMPRDDSLPARLITQGRFLPDQDLPLWRIPISRRPPIWPQGDIDHLYDRSTDPSQTTNKWSEEAAQRERLLELLRNCMAESAAPSEQYLRLGV